MTGWQCIRCNALLDGNPIMCPRCSYTVYRPVTRQTTTQYGHNGQHHGIGTPDCPTDLHHHHDERCEQVPIEVSAVEIVNGVEVPIGQPRQTTTSRGALALLHGEASDPLTDRRQRAREAYYDRYSIGDNIGGSARKAAIRDAIETATRVRVDHEIMAAVFPLIEGKLGLRDTETIIVAAFRAAGFEVEE